MTANIALQKMGIDELIAKADVIGIGQIRSYHPDQWNTKNGKLPPDITAKNISPDFIILRDAEFEIRQFIKGDTAQPVMRIRTFGGKVDQDRMIVEDEPSLDTGQTYLLFLEQDHGTTATINPGHYLIVGSIQGVYRISNGKAISASEQWALEDLINYIQRSLSASMDGLCAAPRNPPGIFAPGRTPGIYEKSARHLRADKSTRHLRY